MKFKVGDRVRVYGPQGKLIATVQVLPSDLEDDGRLGIICDCGKEYAAYPEQCRLLLSKTKRKLKPKQKPVKITLEKFDDIYYQLFGTVYPLKKQRSLMQTQFAQLLGLLPKTKTE
jgi:hypothetical protein